MANNRNDRYHNPANSATSRYTQGGTVDVYPTRLGWWERRVIPKSDSDVTITIQASEDRRPDLIAYNMYQRADLAWLVLQYNNIVDPEVELRAGAKLRLPTQRRVTLDVMSQRIGGNKVE